MVSTQMHSALTSMPRKRTARSPFSRQKAYGWGAAFCFSGAFTLPPLGIVLLIVGWLSGAPWLSTFGSVLLVSVLPFLALGATCLDCRDGNKPQARPNFDDDEEDER